MTRQVYVNGDYVTEDKATVSVFDRGFLFADGVYEVLPVIGGMLLNRAAFAARFRYSLEQLELTCPLPEPGLMEVFRELLLRNKLDEGILYLQVTRGAADRTFSFPKTSKPTLLVFTQEMKIVDHPGLAEGVSVCTVPDLRWKRRDIKSIALLAQCLAKNEAVSRGAYEAWMTEDGKVTEGASSSAYIVRDGTIVTRPLHGDILPGIRRGTLLDLAKEHGIPCELRPFGVGEALAADEAFLSSASTSVLPVVSINGQPVGNGRPGELTLRLRELYLERSLEEARNEPDLSTHTSRWRPRE